MPAQKDLVFGPNNMTSLLGATAYGTIYRIKVVVTVDNNGDFVSATAIPVDINGNEILGPKGQSFQIDGCPEPPGCGNIS